MCERVFDKLWQLHKDTLPPDSTKREQGLKPLSLRLFRSEQYSKKVNCGNRNDVTAVVLIVAYIVGIQTVTQRKARKFALLDETLVYDEQFYHGIWALICEQYAPDNAIITPLDIIPESKRGILADDPDVYRYNMKDICDEYVTYCILTGIKPATRSKCSMMLNLPHKWLALHYLHVPVDNRPLPIARILNFMFGLFRQDYLLRQAPNKTYWNQYAYLTWQYLHYILSEDFKQAEYQRSLHIRSDTGSESKQSRDAKYKRKPAR